MKKMIIGICVMLLVASFAQAQTTQVLSRNAVGYVKVIIPASNKFNMVTANFFAIGQTNMTFTQLFGVGQLRATNLSTRCDVVYTWDRVGQIYQRYAQWTNGLFYFVTNFGSGRTPVNPIVAPGQALWVQSPSGVFGGTSNDLYFMGEVPSVANFTNLFNPEPWSGTPPFFFVANPYPTAVNVNDLINTNDGAVASTLSTRADKLYMWDMAGQRYIILALKAVTNKWFLSTNFNAAAPTFVLEPGQGCWYQARTNFNWRESRPYTWPKYPLEP